MMETLSIKGTEQSPTILFDPQRGHFEISGKSFLEEPVEFYKPVLEWITQYSQRPNPAPSFVFKFEYYNTATAKLIFDMLAVLERIEGARIIWTFPADDPDMKESGLDFAELVNIPFEFIPY